MNYYRYTIYATDGKETTGIVKANTKFEASKKIQEQVKGTPFENGMIVVSEA